MCHSCQFHSYARLMWPLCVERSGVLVNSVVPFFEKKGLKNEKKYKSTGEIIDDEVDDGDEASIGRNPKRLGFSRIFLLIFGCNDPITSHFTLSLADFSCSAWNHQNGLQFGLENFMGGIRSVFQPKLVVTEWN